jgi:hypothetical protein
MRQRKSWEFFRRRFAPPFSEFGRTGSRIRETLIGQCGPRLHKIRLKDSARGVGIRLFSLQVEMRLGPKNKGFCDLTNGHAEAVSR